MYIEIQCCLQGDWCPHHLTSDYLAENEKLGSSRMVQIHTQNMLQCEWKDVVFIEQYALFVYIYINTPCISVYSAYFID